MTLQKAITLFDILIDKYGSPNVSPEETVDMLNMATYEYLNRLFPDSQGGIVNFEMDSNTVANLKPLIWNVSVNMDSTGFLADSTLQTAVRSVSGDNAARVFRISSVGVSTGGQVYPAKFVRQNNLWSFGRNTFKRPTTKAPSFTILGDGVQFAPAQQTSPVFINVIKTPKVLTVAGSAQEMEFSDYSVYNIISIALKLAAVSTRDTEVLEDIRLASLQISQ
jgi:hypothetical protein